MEEITNNPEDNAGQARRMSPVEKLVNRLLLESPLDNRCLHLHVDQIGPYCGKDHVSGSEIRENRRMICDTYSLQLWCLDKESCVKCIVYTGKLNL